MKNRSGPKCVKLKKEIRALLETWPLYISSSFAKRKRGNSTVMGHSLTFMN